MSTVEQVIKKPISLIFALIALMFLVLAVVGGIRSYSPVPFWDMWDGYLNFYVRVYDGDISAWWAQHNEHRIFLSRLIFWIDFELFNGKGWFLIVMNYLLLGMVCLVFWKIWQAVKTKNVPWVGFFMIAWIFLWIQENNLTWGFQSQFILAQLLPLVALYLMHRSAPSATLKCRYFWFSILFGVLSLFSMANGVLTLPLLTLYAVVVRMGWKRCGLLTILSAFTLWLYFHNYKAPSGHGSLSLALRENPMGLMNYALLYVGGPFYYIFKGSFGQIVATIAGIFMVGSSLAFAWRAVPVAQKNTLSIALLIFILYVGGTAFGTACGRLIFGAEQALSSRYMTPALMAWAALLLLYLPTLEKLSQSVVNRVWVPFLILLFLMLPLQLKALEPKQDVLFERQIAALALELGIKDQIQISNIFPSADWALSLAEKPIVRNLSIFGAPQIKDSREIIGQPLTLASQSGHKCKGSIDQVQSIEGNGNYLRLRGWIFDPDRRLVPRSLKLVDEGGIVQGIVLTGQARPDVAKAINPTATGSGFKGFIRASAQGKVISLIDLEGGCQYTGSLPAILFNSTKTTDGSLVSVLTSQVQDQNTWSGTDYYRSSIPGLSILGSFINSDRDKGSVTLNLKRGDKLFYRSGPAGGRQLARVIGHSELKAVLPVETDWVLLDFSSDLLPEVFEIEFIDSGDGWGEWSAIGLKLSRSE